MLSLQGQIEVLRAEGRDQDAAAAQRKLTALTLTQQYERAGFQNAKALADAQVDAVARAQAAQAGLNAAREEGKRWLDLAVDAQRANASEALDRVRYEAEIARLRDWLTNIKEIYECRADIFTNDADVAGSMYDRARAALEPKG